MVKKYVNACASLRPGQLVALCARIKDFNPQTHTAPGVKKEVMHVYAASNFILLRYIEKEKKFRQHIIDLYGECGRLYSFFFTKEIQNVLKLMQDEYEEKNNDKRLGK